MILDTNGSRPSASGRPRIGPTDIRLEEGEFSEFNMFPIISYAFSSLGKVYSMGGDLSGTGGTSPKFEVGDGPCIRPFNISMITFRKKNTPRFLENWRI